MVGDKKTIIKPKRENVRDLVASFVFSSSPIERIYLKPVIIKDITTINTEKEITKFIRENTNPDKSPYAVRLRLLKSINIRIFGKKLQLVKNVIKDKLNQDY